MAAPFVLKNLGSERGFLSRLTGDKDGALAEINNLFARAASITKVSHPDIASACEKHRVKLEKLSMELRAELYERYVTHAFRDRVIADDELAVLSALQSLLQLDDAAVQRAYWDPILEMYGSKVDQAIADGRLGEAEKEELAKLEKDLRIPRERAKRVYDARAGKRVEAHVTQIIGDKEVSPQEEQELSEMCASLDVNVAWSGDSKAIFDRFKENWRLQHGPLTPMEVTINLQGKEKCYAVRNVAWYETRSVTRRINYGGPTARLRIMKGVYWRVGSLAVNRVSEDVNTLIDSGTVYLTNKRVVFMGPKGNKTIRLSRVLDYEVYKNGITLEKDAGKSPFLEFEDQPEHFGVLLGRLMNEGA
jgi:hypothetical protein